MSYQDALIAAGAAVLNFKEFGSYQGDWYAYVSYGDRVGWITGSYGSCSGCDAFQAEFDFSGQEIWDETKREYVVNSEYPAKLAAFGRRYLDEIMSSQAAVNHAAENLSWDMDAEEMVEWVVKVAKSHGDFVIVPQKESKE